MNASKYGIQPRRHLSLTHPFAREVEFFFRIHHRLALGVEDLRAVIQITNPEDVINVVDHLNVNIILSNKGQQKFHIVG